MNYFESEDDYSEEDFSNNFIEVKSEDLIEKTLDCMEIVEKLRLYSDCKGVHFLTSSSSVQDLVLINNKK